MSAVLVCIGVYVLYDARAQWLEDRRALAWTFVGMGTLCLVGAVVWAIYFNG